MAATDPVQAVAEAIQDWTIPGVPAAVVAEAAVAAARPAIEREAKAAGWDEGYGTGYEHADGLYAGPMGPDRHPLNPYRIEREGQS